MIKCKNNSMKIYVDPDRSGRSKTIELLTDLHGKLIHNLLKLLHKQGSLPIIGDWIQVHPDDEGDGVCFVITERHFTLDKRSLSVSFFIIDLETHLIFEND